MDLSTLDFGSRTARLELRNPLDGEVLIDEESGEPVVILLCSADSKPYRRARSRAQADVTNAAVAALSKDSGAEVAVDEDAVDKGVSRTLAAVTKGWEHVIVDGEPLAFSEDAAFTLYEKFTWISDQVQRFVNRRQNFLGN